MSQNASSGDWIADAADQAEAHAFAAKGPGATIVCASGISPSGPIHLGNLREVLTTHFVAEELRRRGHDVVHLHSWDDFDRLRKVPAGIPEHFAQYIGMPLARIPDPFGEHASWADRYITQFRDAAARLGVTARWVRQSEQYPANTYRDAVKTALTRRHELFDVVSRYQTEKLQERSVEERRADYWPFKVYCPVSGKDDTTNLAWDPDTATLTYRSAADGQVRTTCLDDECIGKLVWKVDWPMRWAHERVDFEPGGTDHSSPGSSYTVGTDVVGPFFGWRAPTYVPYAFVGFSGQVKMSSSRGVSATPDFALGFVEPALLRWLYLRRKADAEFQIDFGAQLWRAYDEWDALARKVDDGTAPPVETRMYERAIATSAGPVAHPSRRISFRTLWTALDATHGNLDQTLRIVATTVDDPPDAATLADEIEPRLTCAQGWVENCLDDDERLAPKTAFDPDAWAALDAGQQAAVRRFAAMLPTTAWTYKPVEDLVYGVPKLEAGLGLDDKPTPPVRAAQRAFFVALYQLLLGADTGPRLPTLLLALGRDTVAPLVTPPA
ncbi:MAG: lysine--tRNA ligase [Alphaproteobacteria bacterium]|nr:lysine--tRNA ligase [Alphaproteobacteria bacterium]